MDFLFIVVGSVFGRFVVFRIIGQGDISKHTAAIAVHW